MATLCFLVLLAFGLFGWFVVFRPAFDAGRQVRVVADFQRYRQALEDYHDEHSEYPLLLSETTVGPGAAILSSGEAAIDAWGTPLLYLSDGAFFILVSTGKGGQPDGENYLALRQQAPRKGNDPSCSDPAVDQILTDRGWFRGCGK